MHRKVPKVWYAKNTVAAGRVGFAEFKRGVAARLCLIQFCNGEGGYFFSSPVRCLEHDCTFALSAVCCVVCLPHTVSVLARSSPSGKPVTDSVTVSSVNAF